MTIFYNPAYSSSPYRKGTVEFDTLYCGDTQLLQRLLFFAGVAYKPVSHEERLAHYLSEMQGKITGDSSFYQSFITDAAGMSRVVLAWRDALVEVGWNLKSYKGNSVKLALLRDVEPLEMPQGNADYWNMLIQIAASQSILPEGTQVIVTCAQQEVKPHIAYILSKQQEAGVSVEYRAEKQPCAEGNLGKIQQALIGKSQDKIDLTPNDATLQYLSFVNEDDALRYVATEPVDKAAVYFCSMPKRFDNTLRLLGKPTIGSTLVSNASPVIQLFLLGNGLFDYPLNIHRIIAWLNLPVHPINSGFRRTLCKVLVDSGGINNAEWIQAKEEYIAAVEDYKEKKKLVKELETFLPMPQNAKVEVKAVKAFNNNLRKWTTKQLALKDFHYGDLVKEQIAAVANYCSVLLKILEQAPSEIEFLNLQMWCKNIVQANTYGQYDAEVDSHTTIETMGDIHDVADRVVWFPAKDLGAVTYPFEMLNSAEYSEVEKSGAMPYRREQHTLIHQTTMQRLLLNTKRLTIIEAEKSNGDKVARHPLVLQLNELIQGGLKSMMERKTLSEEHTAIAHQVINQSETPTWVELPEGAKLKERHEHYDDVAKQAESYSSLDQLIQHPFTYVCEKCAKLNDQKMPSAQALNMTLGNVAHLIIEKVFEGRTVEAARDYYEKEYKTIFEESVNEKGLLLRLPEHTLDLNRLKFKMRDALDVLAKTISNNDLTVQACEYAFKQTSWKEAGEGVSLGSRADMLLNDKNGGKVIFDFKYSSSKTRRTEIEGNQALQLELYRYMAKQEFGPATNVRVAYVLLPEVTLLTADSFTDVTAITVTAKRADSNVMSEAAHSYKFRWQQFKAGKIERVEGCNVGTGEYAQQESAQVLFPLSVYDKKYSEDKFDKGYKNLR